MASSTHLQVLVTQFAYARADSAAVVPIVARLGALGERHVEVVAALDEASERIRSGIPVELAAAAFAALVEELAFEGKISLASVLEMTTPQAVTEDWEWE